MKKYVLDIKIDDITMDEALEIAQSWLQKPGKHYIVTPNPEFIVEAESDLAFKKILNSADLSIPDGVGLKLAGIKNRITGVDLMENLVELAAEKGYSVGLLGGRNNLAKLTAEKLQNKSPGLKVAFAESGGEVDIQGKSLKSLKSLKCDLLFVAFGHGKQEKWINNYLDKIPVKVVMGVGGSFEYISGIVPRASKIVRDLGLEWLFRLILQPWRIKRQLALLKYLWLTFKRALG